MKYIYIKVIEAKEVVSRLNFATVTPFVALKYNSSETTKQTTNSKTGSTCWEKTFRFALYNTSRDHVSVEIREKGIHLVRSDWIGEVQIMAKDYLDGKVHQKWFRCGKAIWKKHSWLPKGVLHLKIQVVDGYDRPFTTRPVEKIMTYEEWNDWQENYYAKKLFNPEELPPYPLYEDPHLSSSNNKSRSESSKSLSKKKSSSSSKKSKSSSKSEKRASKKELTRKDSKKEDTKRISPLPSFDSLSDDDSVENAKSLKSSKASAKGQEAGKGKASEGLLIDLSDAIPPPQPYYFVNQQACYAVRSSSSFSPSSSYESLPRSTESEAGAPTGSSMSSSCQLTYAAASTNAYSEYSGYTTEGYWNICDVNSTSKGNPFLEINETLPSYAGQVRSN